MCYTVSRPRWCVTMGERLSGGAMDESMADLLERLTCVEDDPEEWSDEEFAELRQQISERLSSGHRIRFNRLKFFSTDSTEDGWDDMPF